ncbi:MAG: DUF3192 domain-containing protein [Gammaproteobacteria bacterium]|nr:DUF3192 domain-containing protein [Gammaproteobacteria bacterium]
MNVGYAVFSGACLVCGLVMQYGHVSVDYDDDVVIDDASPYSRPVGENWQERQSSNSAYVVTVNEGAHLDDVLNSLGEPDFSQDFENDIKLLMYRTRSEKTDFRTTQDETAVLVFRENRLIGKRDSSDWFGDTRVRADTRTYLVEQTENARKIDELVVGESRSSIISKLGRPDFVDYPAENLEVLSYRTHSRSRDGFTSRDEATSLLLDEEGLVARTISEPQRSG